VPVGEPHLRVRVVAVSHGGGDRGQRRHPRGQHGAAEQRVDQRALAALGLARNQDPQPRRIQPVPEHRDPLPVLARAKNGQFVKGARQGFVSVHLHLHRISDPVEAISRSGGCRWASSP
jgi:hypothetical protein